ncbi:hypothetical protein [Chondromyces crocatus]|uniref:Uncharacterized protein n=1 Tax=Chondromyces crocatus TaxID=52 RepID=A0A0K1EE25_CHOCO|nr:hypothetical protein [Chondromyces crocatus]AKT39094.1 uncharacterized protein CMC5_032410 [Chondromyces crocatus]
MQKWVRRGLGGVVLSGSVLGGCHLLIDHRDGVLREEESPDDGGELGCNGNGIKDGDETGRDCGGGLCPACEDGEGCQVGTDCASRVCIAGTCRAPTCTDGVKNGAESDVDCGGVGDGSCAPCVDGARCEQHADCQSGVCKDERCATTLLWVKQFPALEESSVAGNAEGVVVVTGLTEVEPYLGGDPLPPQTADVGIGSYDPEGKHLWSGVFGDGNASITLSEDVAVFRDGSVAVTGRFDNSIDFGGGPLQASTTDLFVAMFSRDGDHLWSRDSGGSGAGGALVADAKSMDLWITGNYGGNFNLGGGPLPSAGGLYVARLTKSGGHVWSRGLSSNAYGQHIGVDGSGNAVVAGAFSTPVDLGGGPLPHSGGNDFYLLKLSPAGTHLWSKALSGGEVVGIAVDGSGHVVLSGYFSGSLQIGAMQMTSTGHPQNTLPDAFLIKLAPDGSVLWSQHVGTPGTDICRKPAVDPLGNIALACWMDGPADIGGRVLEGSLLLKLDPDGKYLWSATMRGPNGSLGVEDVAAPDSEHIVLSGELSNTFDLGAGPMTSVTYRDLIVARFLVPAGP